MRARHVLAGSTVAVLATVALPAAAQAVPVIPARAILAAHEFPSGSTEYSRNAGPRLDSSDRPTGDPSRFTPCQRSLAAMYARVDRTTSAEATARRSSTKLDVTVIGAPVLDSTRELYRTCNADFPPAERTRDLAAPADIARVRPYIVANGHHELIAWVELRGITLHVDAWTTGGGTPDHDAFWHLLRAQIAKVERQP